MRGRRVDDDPISLFSFQDIITSVTGVIILLALLLVVELARRPPKLTTGEVVSPTVDFAVELSQINSRIVAIESLLKSRASFAKEIASLPLSEIARAEQETLRQIAALESALAQLHSEERRGQERADELSNTATLAEVALFQLRSQNGELAKQLKLVRDSNRVIYKPDTNSPKAPWLVDLHAERILVGQPNENAPIRDFDAAPSNGRGDFLSWAKQRNRGTEYFVLLVRPESIQQYEELSKSLKDAGFSLGFDLVSSDVTVFDPLSPLRPTP